MIIIGLCLHQIHTHRKDYKMQNLYWTDKNELDIIDRNNNEEIEQAENFYKVGQEVCINSSFGMLYGKIKKMNKEKHTLDIWVRPKTNTNHSGIMFQGKTIIHNIPIYALF